MRSSVIFSEDEGDILPSSYNLKIGEVYSSETLGFTQKTIRSQNPEHNKNLYRPKNLKPHTGKPVFVSFLSSHDCKRSNTEKITFDGVA
jgi:hypothetical protein